MEIKKKEVSAKEAEAQLREGKSLESCVIQGVLVLNGSYSHPININDCKIDEIKAIENCKFCETVQFNRSTFSKANFSHTVFEDEVFLCDSTFEGKCDFVDVSFEHVEFGNATFKSEANFRDSEFSELADFSYVTFGDKALFSHAKFNKGANFRNALFMDNASFERATFSQDGFFNEAIFNKKTDFDWSKFLHNADFRRAEFKGPVEFQDADVSAGAHFNYAVFEGCCDFQRSNFFKFNCIRSNVSEVFDFKDVDIEESVDFSETVFILDANFSGTKIGAGGLFKKVQFEKSDFSSTNFGGEVDFSDAIFRRRVIFQNAKFEGTICLLATFSNGAGIEWTQIEGTNGKSTRIRNSVDPENENDHLRASDEFGRLKRVFESNNDYDAMDRAYEMFQHHKNYGVSKGLPLQWINAFFLKFCAGYGTRPLRVLMASLGIITIFALIYAILGEKTFIVAPESGVGYGWDFYLYFSLTTFFAGGVEGVHPDFGGGVKMLIAVETIVGYLLMALFVVMLTRKLTR